MRHCLLFVLVLSISVVTANAAEKALDMVALDASVIDYDLENRALSASGNVQVAYKKYISHSNYLKYTAGDQLTILSGNINIVGPSQNIKAERINYNGGLYSGTIEPFNAKIGKMSITGKSASISPTKIIISKASITGCEASPPDYIIRASELLLYPQWGVLVSFDNWVYVGSIPTLWMPTFIYGSRDYSLFASNSSIPEFGITPREGAHIRQKFGYFVDHQNSGVFSIGLSQHRGPLVSVSHFLSTHDHLHFHFLGASNGSDGIEYAAKGAIDIITEPKQTDTHDDTLLAMFESFNNSLRLPPGQVQFGTTHRENISDSRVSKPYFISFELNDVSLINRETRLSGKLGRSHIIEETLTYKHADDGETNVSGTLSHQIPISSSTSLDLQTFYIGYLYDSQSPWHRLFGRAAVRERWSPAIEAEISLSQKLWNTENKSPFEFERRYAIEGTEIGIKLTSKVGTTIMGVEANYDIDNKKYRNIDFIVTPEYHCWRLPLRWKTIEGQIRFGIELL